ncbi:PQQ-dependent sugar dehydrogenase [Terrimonas alba]|uniref:PQQ-dependent sugar dehydrogenase n=1 Tax=Terrimonas alba TaxID=3349636 RepID=UPI0035F44927
MSRIFITIGVIIVSIVCFSSMSFPGDPFISKADVMDSTRARKNYENYCGGCHGEKMDAFVDRNWEHGNTKEDLWKGIKMGYADEGMPAYDSAFTDEEIMELAEYILTGIEKVKRYQFQNTPVVTNYFESKDINIKLDTIASGLNAPWGIAFLPGNELLVTDKTGKLYRVMKNRNREEITGVPEVLSEGQGGLMDVVLHPDYKKNKLIYLSYSAVKREGQTILATTAIMRAKLVGNNLTDQKLIFEAYPYSRTKHHYGSRMVFDKKGFLFFSVGERGNEKENPQTLANDLGKIHRIKDDGSVPADNPFVNTPGARPTIYSYGHRNPQGLVIHPVTGELWENEHGPRGGDEINLVKKGANYGWPVITRGINYNGKIISSKSEAPGMEQAMLYWTPSIGPSGMAFVTGSRYKAWSGNILTGSLRFKYLNLSKWDGNAIKGEEMLLKNIGRLRDVKMGPDGYIYVTVERPGYVFRLIPGKN